MTVVGKIASDLYAWTLSTLRRGRALWIPEPNKELSLEYRRTGVQIGDVGILRDDGSFDFLFNICCSADDDINRLNNGVPDDFKQLGWNGKKRGTENFFRPGQPVLSRGAKQQALGVEGTASVPGLPVGGGAGLSITFSKDQGAVIIPPNGADSTDSQNLSVFRNYADRNAVSWYKFVNETLGMEVENGAIYLVTGFDKTSCWENAVFSHNLKERMFEIIVNTGGLAAGNGRLHLSDSSLHEAFSSRCSPRGNEYQNQALFVRGFRISMHRKLKSLFRSSPVEITSSYDSLWKDILGKKSSHFPFSRSRSSSSRSRSPSTGSGSLAGSSSPLSRSVCSDLMDEAESSALSDGGYDSDTSVEEDDDLVLSPEPYDPSRVISDYILEFTQHRDDTEVIISHDEDWFALLTDEDVEMPDEREFRRRLENQFRVTVKDGCAYLGRVKDGDTPFRSSVVDCINATGAGSTIVENEITIDKYTLNSDADSWDISSNLDYTPMPDTDSWDTYFGSCPSPSSPPEHPSQSSHCSASYLRIASSYHMPLAPTVAPVLVSHLISSSCLPWQASSPFADRNSQFRTPLYPAFDEWEDHSEVKSTLRTLRPRVRSEPNLGTSRHEVTSLHLWQEDQSFSQMPQNESWIPRIPCDFARLHAKDNVHGDLNGVNVLTTPDPQPRLVGSGLSRHMARRRRKSVQGFQIPGLCPNFSQPHLAMDTERGRKLRRNGSEPRRLLLTEKFTTITINNAHATNNDVYPMRRSPSLPPRLPSYQPSRIMKDPSPSHSAGTEGGTKSSLPFLPSGGVAGFTVKHNLKNHMNSHEDIQKNYSRDSTSSDVKCLDR